MSNRTLSVTKEATFDCAHMLSDYMGLCSNLHGHTYKVHVTVLLEDPTEQSLDNGMLIDYSDLKKAIDHVIKRNYDHVTILASSAYRDAKEQKLYEFVNEQSMRYTIVSGRTTSENMAKSIAGNMLNYLVQEGYVSTDSTIIIKLWETPTSFCEVVL